MFYFDNCNFFILIIDIFVSIFLCHSNYKLFIEVFHIYIFYYYRATNTFTFLLVYMLWIEIPLFSYRYPIVSLPFRLFSQSITSSLICKTLSYIKFPYMKRFCFWPLFCSIVVYPVPILQCSNSMALEVILSKKLSKYLLVVCSPM